MQTKQFSDPVTVLRGHRSDVQTVQFHPALEILYSGDAEGDLNIWSLTTQRILQTQRLHPASAGIIALAVSLTLEHTDAFELISQGRDGTIRAWLLDSTGSLASRQPSREFCSGSYSFCRFSLLKVPAEHPAEHPESPGPGDSQPNEEEPRGSAAAASLNSSTATGVETQTAAPQGAANAAHRGGSSLSAALGREPARREEPPPPHGATEEPGRRLIAVAGENPAMAQVWDLQAFQMLAETRMPEGGPSLGMCMSLQLFRRAGALGLYLAVGHEAGHVAVWDLGELSAPVAVSRLHEEPVLGLVIDANGAGGVSGAAEDRVVCFTIDWEARKISERQRLTIAKPGIDMIALRPDGRVFATGGWDGRVRVFHFAKCKPLTVLKYHKAAVPALAYRHTDGLLASGSRDGTIALWKVY